MIVLHHQGHGMGRSANAEVIGRGARILLCAMITCTFAIAGCGGALDMAGVGGGGTGDGPPPTAGTLPGTPEAPGTGSGPLQLAMIKTLASGPIIDPGTLRIEGVVYDTARATVADDWGRPRSVDELARGMIVEIDGRISIDRTEGVADFIRITSQIAGVVKAVNQATRSLTALDRQVVWNDSTAWNLDVGSAALSPGGSFEAWGFVDPETNTVFATRIEIKRLGNAPTSTGPTTFVDRDIQVVLQGRASLIDMDGGTLRVRDLEIRFADAIVEGGPIREGVTIKVKGVQTGLNGVIRAQRIRTLDRHMSETAELAFLEDHVDRYVSTASFELAGFAVDATQAQFIDGTPGDLGNGVRVQVTGSVQDGVVLALRITVKSRVQNTDEDSVEDNTSSSPINQQSVRTVAETRTLDEFRRVLGDPLIHRSAGWTYELPFCRSDWRIVRALYVGNRFDARFNVMNIKTGERLNTLALAINAPPRETVEPTVITYVNEASWRYVVAYDSRLWKLERVSYLDQRPATARFLLFNEVTKARAWTRPIRVEPPPGKRLGQ